MAALTSTPTPVQQIQHERFTTKQHGFKLWDLSLSLSGNIAVTGCNYNTDRTFIDLYLGRNSDSRDKLKYFYSKEFEKYSDYSYRYVSFLENNASKVVTCIGNEIKIFDTKTETKLLQSCRVNGETRCLAVRKNEIFVGFQYSQTVIVFKNDLKETQKIILKEIKDADYPRDLQVIEDTVYVCTRHGRALSLGVNDSSILTEYTDTTGKYSKAWSITVSERLGLVAVLWGSEATSLWRFLQGLFGVDRIIIYSLNGNKSFLVVNTDFDVFRIRISDRDRTMITGNKDTGEIKMYDLEQFFTYEAMKITMSYLISPDECEKLGKYFGVTVEEMNKIGVGYEEDSAKGSEKEKTVKIMEYLLTIIEEKGHMDPYNISDLKDAISTLGNDVSVSNLKGPIEGYTRHGILKVRYTDLAAEMKTRQKAWEETAVIKVNAYEKTVKSQKVEIQTLTENQTKLKEKLEQTKQSLDLTKTEYANKLDVLKEELQQTKQELDTNMKEKETLIRNLEITNTILGQIAQARDFTRTQLDQHELDIVKVVFNQTGKLMAELQKTTEKDNPFGDLELDETLYEDVPVLAAEFGRLTLAIAEHLTLDHCLKLAMLFNVPPSECDIVLRVSLIESPGVKFLELLKKRKVINMFDVTNLQKALEMLHLQAVNHECVGPYQTKIRHDLYEQYKAEEFVTWKDVDAFLNNVRDDKERHQMIAKETLTEDSNDPDSTSYANSIAQQMKTGVEDSRSHLKDRHHHMYMEQSVGREGGTIQLANVSLIVPPYAFRENHVIALSVMSEPPFVLDKEVDTARMTPLIKLEPLGLMVNKSLKLNIPHTALILEPENHDVIIYSGQISKNNEHSSDNVQWTVESSVPRQLKEKSMTVDIRCLSYLSASLVSHTTAKPLFIVRAIPFIDGVRKTNDDITLTICFCSDNDSDHNMLLSHYKTKLPLEQYLTLYLRRHTEKDEDDAGCLSVNVTSFNNTYVPDVEQAVKSFAVSHLHMTSRISHQLKLKKYQTTGRDVVDIVLTFSQAGYKPTKLFLKSRIKDLIISEESESFLTGCHPRVFEPYDALKNTLSSALKQHHCTELATHFQLMPEDREMINASQNPGNILMKIMEVKELIDSRKMILFFEGLKACHLDDEAEMVSEYVSENSKQSQQEPKLSEDEKNKETKEDSLGSQQMTKIQWTPPKSSVSEQEVQTTLSSSCVSSDSQVKTLTAEGYDVQEVVEALDISKNRLVVARRVLDCLGDQFEMLLKKDMFLYKEQYIDENGGEIALQEAGILMFVPAGALSKGSIVSITTMTSQHVTVPLEGRAPQLTPVVKCGQEGITLSKPVAIRIPHCALVTDGITSTDMYMGFSSYAAETQWRKRKHHEPNPILKEDYFEVFVTQFCALSLNITVDYKKPLAKRLRVLPLIRRVTNQYDDLIVTLWIYNDDEIEHMDLIQEEINVRGNIQLCNFKRITLKSSEKEKEVHIKSGNNKITSYANTNIKKMLAGTLWYNTRHSVEFHFQNKEGISDISFKLRVRTRQFLKTIDDLQVDLKVSLSKLLQKPKGTAEATLGKHEPQPAMERSFQVLIRKLSGQLDIDSCLEIAGIFSLPSELRRKVKNSSEPGKILFDELNREHLITAARVSALDVALTRTGNVKLADDVKEYRRRNVTFPTTIFTLL